MSAHVGTRAFSLVAAFAASTACAAATDTQGAEASTSDALSRLTLDVTGSSASLRGKTWSCKTGVETSAASRLDCTNATDTFEIIVRTGGILGVDAPRSGAAPKTFYECTRTGAHGAFEGSYACTSAASHPRTGGGGLVSPFDSTVTGVHVPNAHQVAPFVFRGMEPRTGADFDALKSAGVRSVLVFKNPTRGSDIPGEIATWGFAASDSLHLPFPYKDLPPFKEVCTQTVDALRFVSEHAQARTPVYFHCTVGEDRTGYLAGLYTMMRDGTAAKTAFSSEVCEWGYGQGNPLKPSFVVGELEKGLTPLYRKMAYLIRTGAIGEGTLDASIACASDPSTGASARDFAASAEGIPADFHCGTSTHFVP